MLARLQQLLCLVLALLSLAWLWGFWDDSPGLAWVGLSLPLLGYGAILAAEFVLLMRHGDPVPRPGVGTLLRAWCAELWCGTQVFFWRQPFRAQAVPDDLAATGRRGVVFVHGLVCNRAFWAPWMRRAEGMGLPYAAVDLEPVFGSIDDYAPLIDAAVARVQAATGLAPVLICHSMGGLAARAWLQTPGAAGRVAHVVTIASPHAGTWMAGLGHGRNARQMRLHSPWLAALRQREAQAATRVPFTCWYSNCDNIVFPVATATLPEADNRFVAGQPHVALAFHPEVVRASLALVDRIAA